jgi:hypothetical protein
VRTLEARFYPASKANAAFVVVGRVLCDDGKASIERVAVAPDAVRPFDASRLHEKLEFFVLTTTGDRYRGLLSLRSRFWSFEPIASLDSDPGRP